MSVTITSFGHLRRYVNGEERLILEGKEGKSLEFVCQEICIPMTLNITFVVNGEQKTKEYLLQPNDEVKLIALLGGGKFAMPKCR
jgi:hypothetical protein